MKDYADPDTLIARAHEKSIDGMVIINCRMVNEFSTIRAVAERHKNVWVTLGTHPHDASRDEEQAVTADHMIARIQSDHKIIGIGESGLDYYYDYSTPTDQDRSFRKHIQVCMETDLPLIVHARDADQDIIKIIKDEIAANPTKTLKGVMHCFSSSRWMAEEALALGFYMSASGIITFKKSEELRDIFKQVPLDRLLVETDSPFLAPDPYRGKTNEPAYVAHTGKKLAYIKDISLEDMAHQTSQNFFTLFSRAKLT